MMRPKNQVLLMRVTLLVVFMSFCSFTLSAEQEGQQSEALETNYSQSLTSESELRVPVLFRERPAFYLFYRDLSQKEETLARARKASSALEKAIKSEGAFEAHSKPVEIIITDRDSALLKVRGYKILEYSQKDVLALGKNSMEELKDYLFNDLEEFVVHAIRRQAIQRGALQFFLAIFFALMGFVVFRYLHQLFRRAEGVLEERRGSFKPLAVLSETLISGQTLGGLLALSIAVGRLVAYLVVILTTMAAILGQFVATRALMTNFLTGIVSQILNGLQALLESIPGLLLALGLVLGLQLSVKILDLFLKGVRSGRISWSFLNIQRIPVLRFWGLALIFSIFGPLIIAAIFGRFQTPIEQILIFGAGILLLAHLPMLASIAVGSFILWQDYIKLGQWVRIGSYSGEVTDISAHQLTLVPEEGGRVFVPMFLLLFKPCVERKDIPKAEFRFSIRRMGSLEESIEQLRQLFLKKIKVDIFCISVSAEQFRFGLLAPKFETDVRTLVMSTLSQAHEQELIRLSSEMIEEVGH